MKTYRVLIAFLGTVITLCFATQTQAEKLQVVASINPIHSLVTRVMAGVGEPELLIKDGQSPHSYSLRPSDVRRLSQADVIFWVGGGLEGSWQKSIANLHSVRVITLAEIDGVTVLRAREGGLWGHSEKQDSNQSKESMHHDAHSSDEIHTHHSHGEYDPHIWLDPENGKVMIEHIARILSEIDPPNAERYSSNSRMAKVALDTLSAEIREMLKPVKEIPYIVFHDAYQYFERRFATRAIGSITIDPERIPGAKRLKQIRQKLIAKEVTCLFVEPHFEPKLATTLVSGSRVRIATLDPLGTIVSRSPGAYSSLLYHLASTLRACLGSAR